MLEHRRTLWNKTETERKFPVALALVASSNYVAFCRYHFSVIFARAEVVYDTFLQL